MDRKAVVRRFVEEAVNGGHDELIGELFAPEMEESAREWFGAFRASFPDVHMDVVKLVAEGDTVVGVLAQRAPTWLVELPWLLEPGPMGVAVRHAAQGATRARMLREMLEALDALGATAPVVLVLEDLHWADDSTLDLIAALLRRREPARLLLIGTFRATGPDWGVRRACATSFPAS